MLQALDVAWMVCLAMSTSMAVPEPPLLITRRVLEFDDEFDADEEFDKEFAPELLVISAKQV